MVTSPSTPASGLNDHPPSTCVSIPDDAVRFRTESASPSGSDELRKRSVIESITAAEPKTSFRYVGPLTRGALFFLSLLFLPFLPFPRRRIARHLSRQGRTRSSAAMG